MKRIAVVDVDEVLADFIGAALQIHGVDPEWQKQNWPLGVYSLVDVLNTTENEFWAPIHEAGERFWYDLAVHPWAMDVIRLVKHHYDGYVLATKPSRNPTSRSGKQQWIQKVFGLHFTHYEIVRDKSRLARPGYTLIDDSPDNVNKFMQEGLEYTAIDQPPPQVILFPHPGNSAAQHYGNPIPYLEQQILMRK